MNDFIDNFEGDGCFIVPTKKPTLFENKNEIGYIENEIMYHIKKKDLEQAQLSRHPYDDHHDLINKPDYFIGYIPVLCINVFSRGKSKFAQLADKSGTFTILIQGSRKIRSNWVRISHDIEKNKVYILKCESRSDFPDELRIIAIKELKK